MLNRHPILDMADFEGAEVAAWPILQDSMYVYTSELFAHDDIDEVQLRHGLLLDYLAEIHIGDDRRFGDNLEAAQLNQEQCDKHMVAVWFIAKDLTLGRICTFQWRFIFRRDVNNIIMTIANQMGINPDDYLYRLIVLLRVD